MGILRKTYNFIMGLIGLLVLGLFVYVFFAMKWEEHKEEERAEEREELVSEVAEDFRARGLGDLDELRDNYFARCPVGGFTVLEGDAEEICTAMADVLLTGSQEREMSVSDHVELLYQLCALEAKQEGEDPSYYCEDERKYALRDTMADALALALCNFERAWVFDHQYITAFSKRGPAAYVDEDVRVDCETGLIEDYDYDGFFEGMAEEDYEYNPPFIEEWYDLLDAEEYAQVKERLAAYEFGKDQQVDFWVLGVFLNDRSANLLADVIERNGGKVDYDINYYEQALSRAIDDEQEKVSLLLLEAGADALRPYSNGTTPIVIAASNGMLEVVKALVARGADVDGVRGSESFDFGKPLELAAMNGHEKTALWLLDNGARLAPEDPSRYPLYEPGYLLAEAAYGGSLAVVERLIERGEKSEDTWRLVSNAVNSGNADMLQLVFEQGYEMPEVERHDDLYDGVVVAIQKEDKDSIEDGLRMFELLLDQGLDMSEMHESGWTLGHQAVIHYAPRSLEPANAGERAATVRSLRLKFVERVIDEVVAAGIVIDQRHESETMLMKAADKGQPELTRYLLGLGADAALKNDKGETALDIAAREGRRLLSHWDDHEALRSRFTQTIEILGGTADMLEPPEKPDSGQ